MNSLFKILGKIFNRVSIMAILILAECGFVFYALFQLNYYAEWISILFKIVAILMALFVIYRDLNPAYKMGWILLICIVPVIGSFCYAMFGNKRPAKRLRSHMDRVEKAHREELEQVYGLGEITGDRSLNMIKYVGKYGPYPAWSETVTEYYSTDSEYYPSLLEDLKNAKHYIFMEYFIIDKGKMWSSISDILKEKAAEGLDVRVTYDGVGSLARLPFGFKKDLEDAGIKVLVFNKMQPLIKLIYNNRDHRKITVVDGYIGHTGGYNLADEYINEINPFGQWKDAGLRLEGKAVWNFTMMFLNMWNAFIPTENDYSKFRPCVHGSKHFDSDGVVQPYSDTPLDDESLGENVYLDMINQATDYIYIFTPYLILDHETETALKLAAKRDVDVKIVTPGIPDKKIIYRLTRSYYSPLIKSGVKIYEYSPGFLHSKCVLSDDNKGVTGTINLDYRSLYLHFECGVLMFGSRALREMKEDFQKTFEKSRKVELQDTRTGFIGTLFDALLRVLSPLF